MASLNLVVLAGNLTCDVDIKHTQSGMAIASFGLAVNKKYTSNGEKQEQVSFFDIDAWGKTADICSEWLSKGSSVIIQGELKQNRWQEENGKARSNIKVVASNVQFLPRAENGNGDSQNQGQNRGQGRSNQNQKSNPPF
jgi:single-strand DNA-binding protein